MCMCVCVGGGGGGRMVGGQTWPSGKYTWRENSGFLWFKSQYEVEPLTMAGNSAGGWGVGVLVVGRLMLEERVCMWGREGWGGGGQGRISG